MSKKKRWFGKGDPEPEPSPDRGAEIEKEIERRAQRAEAVARSKVDEIVKQRVNDYIEGEIDNEVVKVIKVIDQALVRANASIAVSYLALVVVTEHSRMRYTQKILAPKVPPKPPKAGQRVDISTLPPEVQDHIRKSAESEG